MKSATTSKPFPTKPEEISSAIATAPERVDDPECPMTQRPCSSGGVLEEGYRATSGPARARKKSQEDSALCAVQPRGRGVFQVNWRRMADTHGQGTQEMDGNSSHGVIIVPLSPLSIWVLAAPAAFRQVAERFKEGDRSARFSDRKLSTAPAVCQRSNPWPGSRRVAGPLSAKSLHKVSSLCRARADGLPLTGRRRSRLSVCRGWVRRPMVDQDIATTQESLTALISEKTSTCSSARETGLPSPAASRTSRLIRIGILANDNRRHYKLFAERSVRQLKEHVTLRPKNITDRDNSRFICSHRDRSNHDARKTYRSRAYTTAFHENRGYCPPALRASVPRPRFLGNLLGNPFYRRPWRLRLGNCQSYFTS
jgi:hypothetical protein